MKKITITYSRDGSKSTMETEGFAGGECLRAAAKAREILGNVEHEENTATHVASTPAAPST